MAQQRTGIVILTQLVKHTCRVLTKYRNAIDHVLLVAVEEALITSSQKATVDAFLDAASGACAILRLATGY